MTKCTNELSIPDDGYDCILVDLCVETENSIERSSNQIGEGGSKRRESVTSDAIARVKKQCVRTSEVNSEVPLQEPGGGCSRNEQPQQIEIDDKTESEMSSEMLNHKIECLSCKKKYSRKYFTIHLQSNLHKLNTLKKHKNLPNISIMETAFKEKLITYRFYSLNNENEEVLETPDIFLESIRSIFLDLINESKHKYNIFKVNFTLKAEFTGRTKSNCFDFRTLNEIVRPSDTPESIFDNLNATLKAKLCDFEKEDSGCSLKKVLSLDVNFKKVHSLAKVLVSTAT